MPKLWSEALQGVQATGNMALKTVNNPLGKYWQIDRKGGKKCDSISSFLHFGCLSSKILNKLPSVISKHLIIFFGVFSNYGIVQEQSLKGERLIETNSFQVLSLLQIPIEYPKNLCLLLTATFLSKPKCNSDIVSYQVTGSLRND